jgi:hypothetical protein
MNEKRAVLPKGGQLFSLHGDRKNVKIKQASFCKIYVTVTIWNSYKYIL